MNINDAVKAWQTAIGEPKVQTREDELKKYKLCTTGTRRDIAAVLLAGSVDEVVRIVKIAGEFNIPLYPISKGNNWGYGSANPVVNGSVIVDMSGMNQILDFDPELGVVTVEPGVTQQILADFLHKNGDKFMCPTTGAGPQGSILGNALERGYGLTPVTDHFQAVQNLEAVLPDGSIYHSALYENQCQTVDRVFKWGIGPYLDGLFSQGNFGIVTKMTIQLGARPECVGAFILEMRNEKDLEMAVRLIRETLRELGGTVGAINLMNSLRLLSMSTFYPYDEIKKSPENYVEIIRKIAEDFNFAPWNCLGSFYGKKEVVQAASKILKEKVYPYTKRLIFLSRPQLNFLGSVLSFLPSAISKKPLIRIEKLKMYFDILEGRPNQVALNLCYRKVPQNLPEGSAELNPARDGCGLFWYAPLVPMKPELVRTYVDFVEAVCQKHHIEPLITLTGFSDRCFDSTIPIIFDPKNPKEVSQAKDCLEELFTKGRELGFYPYRVNIDMMKDLVNPSQPFWAMQKALKNAIDPKGIIAPGRYSV